MLPTMSYKLTDSQKIWLHECKFGNDMEIKDWFLSLPLSVDNTNMLNDIFLDGHYDDKGRDLLNWLRREYIQTFGKGSTILTKL